MNYGKFKKFALEAGIDIRHIEKHADEEFEDQLSTFAELIVKECIIIADNQRNPATLNYKPSEQFAEDLKLHFGVKE